MITGSTAVLAVADVTKSVGSTPACSASGSPSHQGQRIGQAMVERVLDELRARGAPEGAFVGLFTRKSGFYEKIGFKKDGGMHMQL